MIDPDDIKDITTHWSVEYTNVAFKSLERLDKLHNIKKLIESISNNDMFFFKISNPELFEIITSIKQLAEEGINAKELIF